MSNSSREHLLGYLLGALEPAEQDHVEVELQQDARLRDELERLEACVSRLGFADKPHYFDPPANLAARTCRFVALQSRQQAAVPARRKATPVAGRGSAAAAPWWLSWADLIVAAAVLVVAVSLLFPALSYSRFHAQIAACQNNLRVLGIALHDYSTRQADRSFPGPEAMGNRASAGIYAPTLVSHQLVSAPGVFLCPSSPVMRRSVAFRVPTLEEVDEASGAMLAALQHSMGGDYGYNMGYTQDGKLMRVANRGRSQYVLLADAPSNMQPGRVSANHRGRGQNVLYEDGHMQFVVDLPNLLLPDDPYHNREGWVAAGLDADDAVLGASADRPLPISPISE